MRAAFALAHLAAHANRRRHFRGLQVKPLGGANEVAFVEYPIGHKRRRADGIPLLEAKFRTNLARKFPTKQQQAILALALDQNKLEATPVNDFVDLFTIAA